MDARLFCKQRSYRNRCLAGALDNLSFTECVFALFFQSIVKVRFTKIDARRKWRILVEIQKIVGFAIGKLSVHSIQTKIITLPAIMVLN